MPQLARMPMHSRRRRQQNLFGKQILPSLFPVFLTDSSARSMEFRNGMHIPCGGNRHTFHLAGRIRAEIKSPLPGESGRGRWIGMDGREMIGVRNGFEGVWCPRH